MATPKYQGPGQPPVDPETGVLGRIGAFFGARTTPAYAAAPVAPVAPATPAAVAASAPGVNGTPTSGLTDEPPGTSTITCVCQLDQACSPDPLAGRIAIVVPRGFPLQGG